MMLEGDFRRILDLIDVVAERLACGGGSHGTSYPDLGLTSAFGTGYGSIALCKLSEKTCNTQTPEDSVVRKVPLVLQIVQDCRKDSAGTAGRSSNYCSVIGILFTTCIGIRADKL